MFRKDAVNSGNNVEENFLKPPLEVKWKVGAPSTPNSPAVADGIVYIKFATTIYARDAKTGGLIWSKSTPTEDQSSVAVAYGMVFDVTGKYTAGGICSGCGITAYDAKTGMVKWSYISPTDFPMGGHSPNVDNGVLYFGSDDHYVRAVSAYTGELIWTSPLLNSGIVAVPAVANGMVYVGTWEGNLYALNSINGQIVWQFVAGGVIFSSPSVVDNIIYVGSGSAYVYALDAITGINKWRFGPTEDSVWGSPALSNGILYVQTLAGKIYALDTSTGNLVWTYQTNAQPSTSYSSIAVANGVIYVGSSDHSFYALDAAAGTLLWSYETGDRILSSPAVANGMVYVGSNDGYIYAFGNVEPTPTPSPSSSPTPIPLPSLDVPDIKQYTDAWGSLTYDTANKWSQNPTIKRWGCALTSATMILRYYAHNIWPDTLNDWLKTQSDGYLRNGLLNWLAVSRYTKQNETDGSPVLEYRKLDASSSTLINELELGRPGILDVSGHFVVTKSQLPTTFGINDPAYVDRLTLESYDNTFQSIRGYKPTHTDLSYIFLVVDPTIDIFLTGPDGNKLEGYSSTENPLIDDIDYTSQSGQSLNTFLLPIPESGDYKIEVTGNGNPYTLESYLYDRNGDVTQTFLKGLILENQTDTFSLTYGVANQLKPLLTIDSIIQDLDNAYKQGAINKRQYFIYLVLKLQLLLAKNSIARHKTQSALRILRSCYFTIKALTPRFVSPSASEVLQNDLTTLINSLTF